MPKENPTLPEQISALEAKLATANSAAEKLTADLATANTAITAERAKLDKANGDLTAATAKVTELTAKVTTLEAAATEFKNTLEARASAIATEKMAAVGQPALAQLPPKTGEEKAEDKGKTELHGYDRLISGVKSFLTREDESAKAARSKK